MQRLLKAEDGKVYYTYECLSPTLWRGCQRCIDPLQAGKAKPEQPPAEKPAPAKPAVKAHKCPYEGCIFSADGEDEILRHVERIHHPQKEQPAGETQPPTRAEFYKEPQDPAPELPKSQKSKKSQPTKQQLDHRCKEYPTDCRMCSPAQQDKCGVEAEHRKPPL